jgi:hypothetical protein
MSRSKDYFIEQTGGFRLGESHEQFLQRQREIEEATNGMLDGTLSFEEREAHRQRLYKLKGLSSDEFPSIEEIMEDDDDD